MSCSGRYCRTLAMICASCARVSSSQNTTCAPESRPRSTARRTQSRTGASFTWHARQTSPASTSCDSTDLAGAVHDAHGAVDRDLERLVVRAVLLGLLRHEPDVGHRTHRRRVERAVGLAVVDDRVVHAGVRRVGDDGLACPGVRRPRSTSVPESRIIGGIDASMMMSLGTCRLVMPRSESTIASAGPSCSARGDVALDRGALGVGERGDAAEHVGEAVVGVHADAVERVAVLREHVGEVRLHRVAEDDRVGDLHHRGLEVDREQHALRLGVGHLLGEERVERRARS